MGREATAVCDWDGEVAEVKALLESTEIILRGSVRARIPRANIGGWLVEDDTLVISVDGQKLRLELGRNEAEKWAASLSKPLPTLAEKLGLNGTHRAYVFGNVGEAELEQALSGSVTHDRDDASMIIAILMNDTDLHRAIELAQRMPNCPIWCVYGKGKFATVKDSTIRSSMRVAGFMDNKTSGISDRMTATRYQIRKVST